ncbi:ABC transporter substrate-binding protein [Burkholderiaceae bacterium 16]|nr:ABC transporter substrate-binding protein [Burkholderiaceae bacterium 16]
MSARIPMTSVRSFLAAALVLAASTAHAGKANDTLVYASDSEVENISPYHNNLREGVVLSRMVFDTLLYRDPKSGEYKPQLATAWTWESPTALVIDLRQGVTFQNGDKFSADDVVFTFTYVVSPESKVVTRQNIDWIKSAEKLGEYKVRLHLKAPFPAAFEYLAGPTPILPAAYFKKVGLEGFSKAPIGTGPYKITAVTPGQGVTMVRNPAYFKASPQGQPRIGTLKFVIIPDPETRVAQLMTGAVDWLWRVPSDQADAMRSMPNLTVQSGETMRVGFLMMDAKGNSDPKSPFKDVRVRQAVNYAINRESMAKNLVRGGSQAVPAVCYRTQVGCETKGIASYAYDPAKAKALLAQAGYPNGFETDIYAYRERDFAEAVIGDLQKVGIKARLRYMKYAALQGDYRGGKAPLTFQTWGSNSVNDASASLGVWFKGGADDITRDSAVKAFLDAADSAADLGVRKANYAKALDVIARQAYTAPLFTYSTSYAYTSQLNFQAYPDEVPRFYDASWK